MHIALDENGYRIDHVVEGDSVTEVLGYVQYQKQQLMQRMRQANEEALRRGLLTFEESALLMRRYDEGLSGYTYLEEEDPATRIENGTTGLTAAPPVPPSAARAAARSPRAVSPEPAAGPARRSRRGAASAHRRRADRSRAASCPARSGEAAPPAAARRRAAALPRDDEPRGRAAAAGLEAHEVEPGGDGASVRVAAVEARGVLARGAPALLEHAHAAPGEIEELEPDERGRGQREAQQGRAPRRIRRGSREPGATRGWRPAARP